jgi:hypothetical protein
MRDVLGNYEVCVFTRAVGFQPVRNCQESTPVRWSQNFGRAVVENAG